MQIYIARIWNYKRTLHKTVTVSYGQKDTAWAQKGSSVIAITCRCGSDHSPWCQGLFCLALSLRPMRLLQLQVDSTQINRDCQTCNDRVKTDTAMLDWAEQLQPGCTMYSNEVAKRMASNPVNQTYTMCQRWRSLAQASAAFLDTVTA